MCSFGFLVLTQMMFLLYVFEGWLIFQLVTVYWSDIKLEEAHIDRMGVHVGCKEWEILVSPEFLLWDIVFFLKFRRNEDTLSRNRQIDT